MILLYALVFTDVLGSPLHTAIAFVTDKLFIFARWGFSLAKILFG